MTKLNKIQADDRNVIKRDPWSTLYVCAHRISDLWLEHWTVTWVQIPTQPFMSLGDLGPVTIP